MRISRTLPSRLLLVSFAVPFQIACSTSAPTVPVDVTGTWLGVASDAGPVRWRLTQTVSTVSGSMELLGTSGDTVVKGTVEGTVTADSLRFRQTIAFFQFPETTWYYQMGFQTSGTLTVRGEILTGAYTGVVQALRSAPGPTAPGTPFMNGTLTLTRQ